MVPDVGDDAADGVKGGVDADYIKEDRELNVKECFEEAVGEFEYDLGEGKSEPVEAYNGRSSCGL